MRFLFKYATRSRPVWCLDTLAKYYSMLSGKHDYLFIISLDNDDEKMSCQAMLNKLSAFPDLLVFAGDHDSKIEAINDDVPDNGWDILVVVSDDMIPIEYGFDDIIAKDMKRRFPKLDGALHYSDNLFGLNTTITFSIMGKKLYDALGYIYHPDYSSFYCDNEFTAVVRKMDKYQYVDRVIVEHRWTGFSDPDELHKENDQKGKHDGEIYRIRTARGYPKTSIYEEQ